MICKTLTSPEAKFCHLTIGEVLVKGFRTRSALACFGAAKPEIERLYDKHVQPFMPFS